MIIYSCDVRSVRSNLNMMIIIYNKIKRHCNYVNSSINDVSKWDYINWAWSLRKLNWALWPKMASSCNNWPSSAQMVRWSIWEFLLPWFYKHLLTTPRRTMVGIISNSNITLTWPFHLTKRKGNPRWTKFVIAPIPVKYKNSPNFMFWD